MSSMREDAIARLRDPLSADTTALAYMGDAVYEVRIREYVLQDARIKTQKINQRAIAFVRADAQADVLRTMLREGFLTEQEAALAKRARNRTNTARPRGSSPAAYKLATGFEAVVGWLYFTEDEERLAAVVREAVRIVEDHAAGGESRAAERTEL